MNAAEWWLKVGVILLAILLAASEMAVARVAPTDSPTAASCAAPVYRQFDFWVGDWDAFDVGSPIKVAHARVDRILDGCVLREDYQGADGHKGQSFTIYDAARKVWHQSWVTNRGELLIIEGTSKTGEIMLTGEDHAKGTTVRGVWRPEKDGVRETADTSSDGGKTWKPWFDLVFRPATSAANNANASTANASGNNASANDKSNDEKIVAALDTEYQAAVKMNDADKMSRILADDFVLVTGSGKTYTKADLLTEARTVRAVYERQEDSEQKVRVWGDIAVVTAKLWAKGTEGGKPFEYSLWFSDTYLRTPTGWRYTFAQSSLRLPTNP
ncbi:MAG: nuclear transport factor 2 family protein [Terriglobales bacterium]